MNCSRSPASLAQRRANILAIAKHKREAKECKRGHNNWLVRKNGTRVCRTCVNDRSWYRRHGLQYI